MNYHVLFGAKEDRRRVLEPKLQGSPFAFHMAPLETADLGAFDAVIPLTLADQAVLRHRRAAGESFACLLPDATTEALCHDKMALNLALIAAGFGQHIPPMQAAPPTDAARYPLVLKLRRDEWGLHTRILRDPAELTGFNPDTAFLQDLVPGSDELATHLLVRGGEIRFDRTVHYTMEAPLLVKGRHANPCQSRWLPQTPGLALFQQMIRAIGFVDGICCIDYRLVDGVVQLFEINPRFGASLAARADALLPAYLAVLAEGAAVPAA